MEEVMRQERRAKIEKVLVQRQFNVAVLLENVLDLMNVSNVFRSCDAAGVMNVFVLNNRIEPHRHWGRQSAKGSFKWLNIRQYTDTKKCLKDVFASYDQLLLADANPAAVSLHETDFTGSVVIAFGNEHSGATDELKQAASGHFYIPMMGMAQSLNVANAAAITLYEAMRQKTPLGHYITSSLDAKSHRKLLDFWLSRREEALHITTAAVVGKDASEAR